LNNSHNLEPFKLPPGIADEYLTQRFKDYQSKEILDKLKKKGITLEQLQEFRKNHPEFLSDPDKLPDSIKEQLPSDLKEMLKQKGPELKESLEKALDKQQAEKAESPNTIGPDGKPRKQPPSLNGQPPPVPNGAPNPTRPTEGQPTPPDSIDNRTPFQRWMLDKVDRLDRHMPDSPGLRKAMSDLTRSVKSDDPRWEKLNSAGEEFKGRWSKAIEDAGVERLVPEKTPAWPRSLTPGKIPWPSWSSGNSSTPRLGMPSTPGEGSITQSNGWQLVLGSLGLLLFAFLLWRMRGQPSEAQAEGGPGWRLGPWPVNPATVATREDLVRAFEYLSLLRLGREARAWNHRAIAERLGGAQTAYSTAPGDDFQRTAEELAGLYEHARYAPAHEPLPDRALVQARRDLCLLAGVSSA
jgi:hypothetical protein